MPINNEVQFQEIGNDRHSFTIVQTNGEEQRVLCNSVTYPSKQEALGAFFAIFFGSYDDSFLDAYTEWQTFMVGQPVPDSYIRLKPGTIERLGQKVDTAPKYESDGPNYEATEHKEDVTRGGALGGS